MGLKNIDATPPYMRKKEGVPISVLEKMREKPILSSLWIVYSGTALVTFFMILIDSMIQSTGFFGFIWQTIKGGFVGIIYGIFWPILLLFNMHEMWAIWFPCIGFLILVYSIFYEQKVYKMYFLSILVIYVLLTFGALISYFK
jgi:hypothetical protein